MRTWLQTPSCVGNNNLFIFPGTGKEGHLADPKKAWNGICLNATIKLWKLDNTLAKLIEAVQIKEDLSINQIHKDILQLAKKQKLNCRLG